MNWLEFYEGRGLVVDLASGKVRQEALKPEDAEAKVGGAALNVALFQRYAESDPIILSTGPLTASFAPASCLAVMTAKSPVNGNLYHVPLTWQAGAELKFSGLDYIVLLAQANKPVMLRVRRGQAELTSAETLWGKDIPETVRTVRSANPGDSRSILAIGPAGEGKTPYAQVNQNFWGTLDKAGFGAAWGRKKLKALVMTGMGGRVKVDPDHPALSRQLAEEIKKGMPAKMTGSTAILKKLGEKTPGPGLLSSPAKHFACFHCPFPCQTFIEKKSSTAISGKKENPGDAPPDRPRGCHGFPQPGKEGIRLSGRMFPAGPGAHGCGALFRIGKRRRGGQTWGLFKPSATGRRPIGKRAVQYPETRSLARSRKRHHSHSR